MRKIVLEKKYITVKGNKLEFQILNGTCNAIIEEILKNPDCLTPDCMETYEVFHTDSIYTKILKECYGSNFAEKITDIFPETIISVSTVVPEISNVAMVAQDLCRFIYDQIINNGMYADYYLSILIRLHPLDKGEELLHYKAQICKKLLEAISEIQDKMLGNLK